MAPVQNAARLKFTKAPITDGMETASRSKRWATKSLKYSQQKPTSASTAAISKFM